MTSQRFRGPAHALLVIDQRSLADVVILALSHGHYTTRVANTAEHVSTALADWQPHLLVVDMDMAESVSGTPLGRDASGQARARHLAHATRRPEIQAGGFRARR
jgi:CheY-like chemotaxis protein